MSLLDGTRAGVRLRVRVCVGLSTLLNINISVTSRPIAIKFYPKHNLGVGKAALGFGEYRFRTLVFVATESSHRVIMGKTVLPLFLGCFSSDFLHLQVTTTRVRNSARSDHRLRG